MINIEIYVILHDRMFEMIANEAIQIIISY